jgi:hypothetical protein
MPADFSRPPIVSVCICVHLRFNSGSQDRSGNFNCCADYDPTKIHVPRIHRIFLVCICGHLRHLRLK